MAEPKRRLNTEDSDSLKTKTPRLNPPSDQANHRATIEALQFANHRLTTHVAALHAFISQEYLHLPLPANLLSSIFHPPSPLAIPSPISFYVSEITANITTALAHPINTIPPAYTRAMFIKCCRLQLLPGGAKPALRLLIKLGTGPRFEYADKEVDEAALKLALEGFDITMGDGRWEGEDARVFLEEMRGREGMGSSEEEGWRLSRAYGGASRRMKRTQQFLREAQVAIEAKGLVKLAIRGRLPVELVGRIFRYVLEENDLPKPDLWKEVWEPPPVLPVCERGVREHDDASCPRWMRTMWDEEQRRWVYYHKGQMPCRFQPCEGHHEIEDVEVDDVHPTILAALALEEDSAAW